MSDFSIRREAWSRYWEQGEIHSLAGSLAGGFEGSIRSFWLTQFERLNADCRVLDIGTGNGALPRLIYERHPASPPAVDAVDLADVSPAWQQGLPPDHRERMRFHSRTRAEALPFPERSFDLAISQYGFEYTDLSRSVPELARVLKPGAGIAFVMHHADSRLVAVAREELRLSEWLLDASDVTRTLDRISPYLAMASQPSLRERLQADPAATLARESFNTSMQALAHEAARSPFPDLLHEAKEFVVSCMERASRGRPDDVPARIEAYRVALGDAKLRYAELCSCALDTDGLIAFRQRLEENGIGDVAFAPIAHENGLLMGWTLTATRSTGT